MGEWTHLYNYKWQKHRELFLKQNPLCAYCQDDGKIEAATVVDHITPHKGNMSLFWDVDNHQSLCATHHAATKQIMESGKKVEPVGLDGWPRKDKT